MKNNGIINECFEYFLEEMKDDEVGEESLNSDSEEEYNINKLNDATKILENIIMEIDDTNFQPLEIIL